MTFRTMVGLITQHEGLNFVLTNQIARNTMTRFMGWFSQLRHPLVKNASIRVWQLFCDLDLSESKHTEFASMHECFIRELKPSARPIDPDPAVLVSPCDGIVGAFGQIHHDTLLQAKGFPYTLTELLGDRRTDFEGGWYVTLRITAGMYHRFHAPADLRVDHVKYMSGDTWNVNPVALKRVDKLFCKNERAVLSCTLSDGVEIALVPVAAVLVASIRLHCVTPLLNQAYTGPIELPCDAGYTKGQEMGWFEHGSTIIVLCPPGVEPSNTISEGAIIKMGHPLLVKNGADAAHGA